MFPEIVNSYVGAESLVALRTLSKFVNPSDYTFKGFKGVDSAPYGGGPGMLMRVDVLTEALEKGVFSHYDNPKKTYL